MHGRPAKMVSGIRVSIGLTASSMDRTIAVPIKHSKCLYNLKSDFYAYLFILFGVSVVTIAT